MLTLLTRWDRNLDVDTAYQLWQKTWSWLISNCADNPLNKQASFIYFFIIRMRHTRTNPIFPLNSINPCETVNSWFIFLVFFSCFISTTQHQSTVFQGPLSPARLSHGWSQDYCLVFIHAATPRQSGETMTLFPIIVWCVYQLPHRDRAGRPWLCSLS